MLFHIITLVFYATNTQAHKYKHISISMCNRNEMLMKHINEMQHVISRDQQSLISITVEVQ